MNTMRAFRSCCVDAIIILMWMDRYKTQLLFGVANRMGFSTYLTFHAVLEDNPEDWGGYIVGKTMRYFAASGLCLDVGSLGIYILVVPEMVRHFTVGDAHAVNLRALLQASGELVEPMALQLHAVLLSNQLETGSANGGANGCVNSG